MSNLNQVKESYTVGATALVEGDIVKLSSGVLVKVAAAEATDAVGIVYADAGVGEKCTVVVRGEVDAHILVEDTDSSSGYDSAVAEGSLMIISGKTSGTYDVGQALSAVGGTAQATAVAGMVVGKALEAEAGSTTADTYSSKKVYVNFM